MPAGRVLLTSLAWAAIACTPTPSPAPAAPGPTHAAAPSASAETTPPRWPHADHVASWPVVARYESANHLVPEPTTQLRVTPHAEHAYRNWSRGSLLEPGAVLVAEFVDAGGLPAEWFVMERSAAGWAYAIVAPSGAVTATDPDGCVACHAEATSDQVFGPAR